jgi:hypothetical protein
MVSFLLQENSALLLVKAHIPDSLQDRLNAPIWKTISSLVSAPHEAEAI